MILCPLYVLRPVSLNNFLVDEASNNGNREQIWNTDGTTFPKIENMQIDKAQLCPVYVLHRETPQVNGRSYRNYDRGRSNSPPNRRQNEDVAENLDNSNGNRAKKNFRQNEQFKKSFSSEQLYSGNNKTFEPTSYSLSSRSSTTSTGSSTKSGVWFREFRSGIPVPITSETKLKFRTNRNSTEAYGPLVVQDSKNRTKLESSHTTPTIRRSSPQVFTQQLPPPSSGSESSGYFTPPAEHHLKDQVLERFVPDEHFEENNNFTEPEANFQIVDSEVSEYHESEIMRQSSVSSVEMNERLNDGSFEESTSVDNNNDRKQYSPLDEVDFNENPRNFTHPRSKSRSEANLQSSLPEITVRKNINSAPPLNDLVNIVPYSVADTTKISSNTISLPGSVASSDNTPTKKIVVSLNLEHTPRRLMRRSISVRTASVKRTSKSPKTPDTKSLRPKEMLHQSLNQMESSEWEIVIQGLNTLIRLSESHSDILESQMHSICVVLAKNIRNLRSQVARIACHAAGEIFASCKKGVDGELEELAVPLLQRTADTNKFLRSDANSALDAMSLNGSVPRVVSVIANKGSTHQNCVVRAAATRLLSDIAMRIGPERVFQLPKETRDKFLYVGANGLTEGSLETRRYAKSLMSTLVGHQQFQKALADAVSQHTLRHITKVVNSLK